MDFIEIVLHYWPIVWGLGGAFVGWCAKAIGDYRRKDKADHQAIQDLTAQVSDIKADFDAIKAGNVAQYQESIASANRRYVEEGVPLTIASRERVNAIMRSLAALDDCGGTYQSMVDEINEQPIYQPHGN